jgi:DHA1 family tetracycline resistance protein-like MFS transporter
MNILLLTLSLFSLLKCIDCRSFSSFSEINKKLPTSRRKDRSFLDVFCNEIADEVSKYNVTNRGNMILGIALPWLYFLSVSINMPTFPKFVNWCINNGNSDVTPRSSKVFGRLSAFDSLFTFLSVNLVGCLSDRYGRKPFLMLSSLGLGFAYLIATFSRLPWQFYLAASIDGSTSSMFAQAQAYITDCCNDDSIDDVSEISAALGRFQGFAIGLAFVLGIPLGSLLAKKSLLLPLYTSIIICTFATVLIFFFLPESLQFHRNANNEIIRKNIDWKNANPFGAFHMLSTRGRNLVFCSIAYFFLNLSQCGAQIIWINYLQYRFGWPSEISGLAFVFVGLMVTVTPKFLM